MDILDDESKMKVWDILETYAPVKTLCRCNPMFTVAIHLTGDVTMTNGYVIANANIFDAELIPSSFCGHPIHASKCDCEPLQSFPVKFPMWQWELIQSEYQSLILVGATWKDGVVDMSMYFSAVLPAPWRDAFQSTMDRSVTCFEMFAGGFGGWSHAIRALADQNIPIFTSCALDRDDLCCRAFVKSHAFDFAATNGTDCRSKMQDCEFRGINPKIFFHSSMENIWWMTFLKHERIDMWCMSPPCPPWSCVDLSAGLRRADGRNLILSLMLVALARPKVLALENVSSLISHKHWTIVKEVFCLIGYHIRWSKTLDLSDIIPQRRERLILIATDLRRTDAMPFVCQMWPTSLKHSFRSYGALMDIKLHERWMSNATLTPEELQLFLDPVNLPKDAKTSGHVKRSSRDVARYRIRTADDTAACILTSYGFPTLLHLPLIQRGGVYGSLVLEGGSLRKMVVPELLILMGLINETWMPCDLVQATQLIGNAISVPHALIGVLNGMMFMEVTHLDIPIQEVFASITGQAIRANIIHYRFDNDGVWIGRGDKDDDDILSTQPMLRLSHLIVQAPTESFTLLCQEGIQVKQILKALTGPSMPLQVDLELSQNPKIKMPVPEQLKMDGMDLTIIINVPCRFMMDEINFSVCQQSFVVILTDKLPIVVSRTSRFMIQDVWVSLIAAGHDTSQNLNFVGVAQRPFSLTDICPDAIFVVRPTAEVIESQLQSLKEHVLVSDRCIVWKGNVSVIREVHETLRKLGIVDVLSCLGWHFTMTIPKVEIDDEVVMFLTAKPGHLPATFQTAQSMCIVMTFLMLLPESKPFDHDFIFVRVKIWNSIVWKGFVQKSDTGNLFLQAWIQATEIFQTSMEMRLITQGRQMNPDWEIRHYTQVEQTITIHLVQGLSGGGPKRCEIDNPIIVDESTDESEPDPLQIENNSFDEAVTVLVNQMTQRFPNQIIHDLSQFDNMHFVVEACQMYASGTAAQVIRIMSTFHHTGIEAMLQEIGWSMVLEMKHYGQPSRANLLLFPTPGIRSGTVTLVQAFLVSALTILTFPDPCSDITHAIRVQIKMWGSWIFDRFVNGTLACRSFLDGWSRISAFMGKPSEMRLISRGRRVNPDQSIRHYRHRSRTGDFEVRMHLILELRGGGGTTPTNDQLTRTKNGVATLLLEQGCDLQETSQFVDRILSSAGFSAIDQILKQKGQTTQFAAMTALSKALNLVMPNGLKQAVARNNQVQKMLQKKAFQEVTLNPNDYQVKPGFLCNQDGTQCVQRECFRGSSTGFSLMDAESAQPWIQQQQCVSQDELGILVIGKCPAEGSAKCHRVAAPAFDKSEQPVILDCCLHQMGHKKLVVKPLKTTDVTVSSTSVMAFTVFKDEVDDRTWEQFISAPVRTMFELLAVTDVKINLPCPPWGRSWRDMKGKSSPTNALSFQCHVRVEDSNKKDLLKISGQAGLYVTPKSDNHEIDTNYGIIWLDQSLEQMRVLTSSFPQGLGLVKVVKGKSTKISRGIRVAKDDYSMAFKHFKPHVDIPDMVKVDYLAKLCPTPLGASMDDVKKWIKGMGWQARPIKPLGSETWLLGLTEKIDDQFVQWGDNMMLLSWLPNKRHEKSQAILAGPKPKSDIVENREQTPGMQPDPWASYLMNRKPIVESGASSKSQQSHASVIRAPEGPIEDRFKKQDAQIETLKSSVQMMSQQLDKRAKEYQEFQKQVATDFVDIKTDLTKQLAKSTDTFERTLHQSLRRQDEQLKSAIGDLKAFIQQTPIPQKKAKVAKPPGEHEEPDEGHDL